MGAAANVVGVPEVPNAQSHTNQSWRRNLSRRPSLSRNGHSVSRRGAFLGALFSSLLALALFNPGAVTAQEVKQIKLTEKHIQGFLAASKDMAQLYNGADPDKPDPKVEA